MAKKSLAFARLFLLFHLLEPIHHRIHDLFQYRGLVGVIGHVLLEEAVGEAIVIKHLSVIVFGQTGIGFALRLFLLQHGLNQIDIRHHVDHLLLRKQQLGLLDLFTMATAHDGSREQQHQQ